MDEELLTRIRKEAYEQGYQDGKVDGYNLAGTKLFKRKKGKWIDEKINSYTSRTYCSECGNSAPFICVSGNCDYYGRNMHGELNKTKFCPNCGAEMAERRTDDADT